VRTREPAGTNIGVTSSSKLTEPTDDRRPAVTVTPCPDGPLLVRGDVRFVAADGTEIPRHRRTVALCRCGRSGIAPWCDGTHKVVGFRTGD